ncbi:BZ3500_MvSof-1268-A1-R1_Chr10-2g02979 [Microbotryum saponariae]|uniref:BZ3500_MvSof-1268-A1-R1_Chr10-2g02979 protein n=1 Tax=Microbotryum saponariae TaxID=289078 RepID=A0A2X0LYZ5_9BASI|nr:BZ3501_MvSof-1269-A2-R1_Chr10-2g02565 [Microbotryum saponariae]SDA01865.1 BZ3500_MvSof-1268-A1-R1_Chr10-2g02979 [Microbotryum saponariae]
MTFLRRKSSSKTRPEPSGSPVELTLPVIEPSLPNGGIFSGTALLGAVAGGAGPTSVMSSVGKPVSPTSKEDASSEPSSPPVPVRKVSMVPIPRPISTYSRTKSYNRKDEPPPLPISGTEAKSLANGESPTKTTMTRSSSYPQNVARGSATRQSIASLYPSPNIGVDFDSFSLLQTPQALANGLGPSGGGGGGGFVAPNRSRVTKSSSTPNFVRRSHRVAPPLNLIVVGAKSTGKTGWIRTFLGNLELGSDAPKSRESIRNFGIGDPSSRRGAKRKGKIVPTWQTQTISIEVIGPHNEKIALTCVDTVALDRSDEEDGVKGMSPLSRGWSALDEMKVERQLGKILRIVEERFDETLKAESQVVRPSARSPDSHFHLCLYFIHPDSVRPQIRANGHSTATSEEAKRGAAMNGQEQNGFPAEDDEYDDEMGMTETDLKCIKKLSQRVHVLPIIARADELTVRRLEEVKEAVRRDLTRSGVSFGAFSSASALSVDEDDEENENDEETDDEGESTPPNTRTRRGSSKTEGAADASKVEENEAPVKVIRIARGRLSTLPPSRRRTSAAAEAAEFEEPIETPTFDDFLPFAVVAPEEATGGKKDPSRNEGDDDLTEETYERCFKYGSLNVLDPSHCDFTPLKEAIFIKMKTLKETTRLDKYEPFRTERLLETRKTNKLVAGGGRGRAVNGALSARQTLTKDLLREVEQI